MLNLEVVIVKFFFFLMQEDTWRSNTIIPIVTGKKQVSVFSGYNTKCIPVCIILVFLLIQWGSFVWK